MAKHRHITIKTNKSDKKQKNLWRISKADTAGNPDVAYQARKSGRLPTEAVSI
jgi:hypothetical protein